MAKIDLSMAYLIENEGGYSEPPQNDQPTNFGIIAADLALYRNQPVSDITKDMIKNLTLATATEIYHQQYWHVMSLDQVEDQNIATCIFDTGVNRGVHIGALYAQQVCNLCGDNLVCDGVIGPLTLSGINGFEAKQFIPYYENLEWSGYQAILAHHPEDEKYRHGWESRCKRLLTLI